VLEVTQPTTRYKSFNEFARSSTIIQNPYYFIGVTGASGHYLVEERVVCSVIGFEFVSIFMVHSWDLITFIIIVQLMINAMSSNSSGIEAVQRIKYGVIIIIVGLVIRKANVPVTKTKHQLSESMDTVNYFSCLLHYCLSPHSFIF
jgi:hypothetical protein